jgi:TolB protein
MHDDWLYTGRAFSLNPLILSAGWMAAVREDFNGKTYWRLYLKARFQDGSAGIPLTQPIWDLNARFSGSPKAYEQGGQPGTIPSGYWIDLTEMAMNYGWERLPARTNWRNFFPGVRFNQFVIRDGLDWNQAMSQVYPPEALATPTSIPTYTNTPTATLVPTRTPIPTRTPTPTRTPSPTVTLPPTDTLPPSGPQR